MDASLAFLRYYSLVARKDADVWYCIVKRELVNYDW